MPMSFILSKNVEHSWQKTLRELMDRFTNFTHRWFLWSSLDTALFYALYCCEGKTRNQLLILEHIGTWTGSEKKIWTIIFTGYYRGIQKTINIGIVWRVNINYGLKWLGNEVKDWVARWAYIGRKKVHPWNYFCIFYSFKLKLCRMVELCIPIELFNSFFTFHSIVSCFFKIIYLFSAYLEMLILLSILWRHFPTKHR